ncbi:ABC transporter ATP-binding protein [candidate division KSB1 bacterium RBG_16_48_16]|nr:MAG: ABC transporter ATP-binding protein [candidate division KSB1 bacterium RBG_16_48_16]
MKNDILLKAQNLKKSYKTGRNSELPVIKGIDLEVNEGEIIAVIGPSGVGKSTLLHVLGTLDRPTRGSVEIDGVDVFKYDDARLSEFRNKTIGFVYQFHHLLPEFTAIENIMMPGLICRRNPKELKEASLRLLDEIGLADRAHHRPNELSGGEQQRVAVARALINQPRLVLADEPSGNLDVRTAEALHDLLWNLVKQHRKTLIVVTHNPDLAARSDRIVELYDGKIKA